MTKNYGSNTMHWFWRVVISILLLCIWWKIRRYLSCPKSQQARKKTETADEWNQRQLEKMKYKRKLKDVRSLKDALGLEHGSTHSEAHRTYDNSTSS